VEIPREMESATQLQRYLLGVVGRTVPQPKADTERPPTDPSASLSMRQPTHMEWREKWARLELDLTLGAGY
jgi:hypothetical protein